MICNEFELEGLFEEDRLRNAVRIPVASKRLSSPDKPAALNHLRVVVNDPDKLRMSHGGTGIIQIPLNGVFKVEARAFSGPSVEITLREVE